jgi:hypothetical protein
MACPRAAGAIRAGEVIGEFELTLSRAVRLPDQSSRRIRIFLNHAASLWFCREIWHCFRG